MIRLIYAAADHKNKSKEKEKKIQNYSQLVVLLQEERNKLLFIIQTNYLIVFVCVCVFIQQNE